MTNEESAVSLVKKDLVDAVAGRIGITKKNADDAVKAVLQCILDMLLQYGRMKLANFGVFKVARTKARTGRNPATGEPIEIPAGCRIDFKASKTWKDSLAPCKQEQERKQEQKPKATKPAASDARAAKPAAKAKPATGKNWKKR